jgi:hypothetical protein
MKLISLFNVILDFNAPDPAFHKFFNSVRFFFFFGFFFSQFLERIVTTDENLVYHYEPECKELRLWLENARHYPWLRNSKFNHQPVRLCLKIFWDMKDAILVHFTPKGEAVNSQNYCDVLRTKLKPRSKNWCGAKLVKEATKKKKFLLVEL